MNILVTGASGMIGSALSRQLKSRKHTLFFLVRRSPQAAQEISWNPGSGKLDAAPLEGMDAVVHLGARVGWGSSTREELFQPNILATAELVHRARQQNSYFVFASAALIAGERNPHINDVSLVNTENDYLYSKWLGEEIIKMSGVRYGILRIPGIFGKNGPSHLGVNNAIAGALQGIPPVQYGDGLIKPKAFIVLKDGRRGDEALREQLKTHVKHLLAPYKYPRWMEFVEELPKTATGKIQRFKLREMAAR